MDPLQILREDQERIRRLFDDVAEADDDAERRSFFDRLREALLAHAFVEETVFYPAFAVFESCSDTLDDSFEDLLEVADLLEEMQDARPAGTLSPERDADDFLDQLEDLRDLVDEHFDSEELELFPRVAELLTPEEITRLGNLMLDAREGTRRRGPRAA